MGDISLVSIIAPVFNEAGVLDELIDRLLAVCDRLPGPAEILLVDDGSSDGSASKAFAAADRHRGKIAAVALERNFGQHAAILAGFSVARGDTVVTIDADLQNPPEEIPALVLRAMDGFDLVGAVRSPRCDSRLRRSASWLMNRFASLATGVAMTDCGCMLRAYSSEVVQAVLGSDLRRPFIPVLAAHYAHRSCEIVVRHEARRAGRSKYGLLKLLRLFSDLGGSVRKPGRRAPGPDPRFVIRSLTGAQPAGESRVVHP